MFEFVQPLWMLAASGIIIPVLIHLWNIREGKTLKVGSVSLLIQSSRQAARSFRVRDWLLLVLRCLLIMLLASLMAEPRRLQTRKAGREQGWILLEKQDIQEVYARFRPQIDSLTKAGFQLHYFEHGFPRTTANEILASKDTSKNTTTSYWALLQKLHRQVPASLPVYLYTGNRLNRFSGNRPALSMNLHWQSFTPVDSTSAWLASAKLTNSDSIKLIKASSHPEVLEFTTQYIPAATAAQYGYNLNFEQGSMLLSPADSNLGGPVVVDTSSMRIVIFTDTYGNDASYLQAAIKAIRVYSNQRMEVQVTGNINALPSNPDWLFWLSDKPVPASITGTHLFHYVPGEPQQVHSWMNQHNTETSAEPVAVYKTVNAGIKDQPATELIWEDGFGHPLLTRVMLDSTSLLSFYSRFNPQWNDLPWSSRFPVWMLQLLLPAHYDVYAMKADKRSLDEQQFYSAAKSSGNSEAATDIVERTDLSKLIWIIVFILLLAERIISYSSKKVKPA